MAKSARRRSVRPRVDALEPRTLLSVGGRISDPLLDQPFEHRDALPIIDPVEDSSILVRFRDVGRPSPEARAVLNQMGAAIARTWNSGTSLVVLGQGADVAASLTRLRAAPDVVFAEPNSIVKHFSLLPVIPNDPMFNRLWGLNQANDIDINAPEAWSINRGNDSTLVSVPDTGVDYTHPDLYLNIWLNQGEIPPALRGGIVDTNGDGRIDFWDLNSLGANGNVVRNGNGAPINAPYVTDFDGSGYIHAGDLLADPRWADGIDHDNNGFVDDLVGWNFVEDNNDPFDDNGHGTHVAGTIAALADNNRGIVGVSWHARILPVRMLGSQGSGTIDDGISAVEYSTDLGARIINASWGLVAFAGPQSMADAIAYAGEFQSILVAAAGNSALNNDGPIRAFPASYGLPNILSVAAVNRSGNLAGFSNFGATSVHLAAPGVGILSTLPDGRYGSRQGTSMAAPHVSGVLALMIGVVARRV